MVSGFHWAQQHSAPLLLYLPFIHSLSHLSASFLYHLTLNCQSMFIYPLSLYSPRLLRSSLFFLSSHPLLFYLYAPCLILFIALALPLSRSLFCCLTLSLYPIPSRCRTTSVELIRYSRHIWTALTGINHECF